MSQWALHAPDPMVRHHATSLFSRNVLHSASATNEYSAPARFLGYPCMWTIHEKCRRLDQARRG